MSRFISLFALAMTIGFSPAIFAQDAAQASEQPPPQTSSTPPSIDPAKLGISFDRVRIELTHPAPSKTAGLKIQETIEVVGKEPKQFFWNPETVNLTSSAIPFGAPTQKDIMKLIVPKEFQTYPFDLNQLMIWLMEHLNKRSE